MTTLVLAVALLMTFGMMWHDNQANGNNR